MTPATITNMLKVKNVSAISKGWSKISCLTAWTRKSPRASASLSRVPRASRTAWVCWWPSVTPPGVGDENGVCLIGPAGENGLPVLKAHEQRLWDSLYHGKYVPKAAQALEVFHLPHREPVGTAASQDLNGVSRTELQLPGQPRRDDDLPRRGSRKRRRAPSKVGQLVRVEGHHRYLRLDQDGLTGVWVDLLHRRLLLDHGHGPVDERCLLGGLGRVVERVYSQQSRYRLPVKVEASGTLRPR